MTIKFKDLAIGGFACEGDSVALRNCPPGTTTETGLATALVDRSEVAELEADVDRVLATIDDKDDVAALKEKFEAAAARAQARWNQLNADPTI